MALPPITSRRALIASAVLLAVPLIFVLDRAISDEPTNVATPEAGAPAAVAAVTASPPTTPAARASVPPETTTPTTAATKQPASAAVSTTFTTLLLAANVSLRASFSTPFSSRVPKGS